jgi:hypothetical protein
MFIVLPRLEPSHSPISHLRPIFQNLQRQAVPWGAQLVGPWCLCGFSIFPRSVAPLAAVQTGTASAPLTPRKSSIPRLQGTARHCKARSDSVTERLQRFQKPENSSNMFERVTLFQVSEKVFLQRVLRHFRTATSAYIVQSWR